MNRWIGILLMVWLGGACAAAPEPPAASRAAGRLPQQIIIASEAWIGYTNQDGTGLAWDVFREVFEPAGVHVIRRTEPYLRSVGLVQRGEADAWAGSYQNETDSLYPRWNYDIDRIYALGLAGKPSPTLGSIGQFRLAWVRGYSFERYLPDAHQFSEIQRRVGIPLMLERGRADFYVDALTEIEDVLAGTDRVRFTSTHLRDLPVYLGFGNTAKGRALMAVFDQRMGELVASGQLRKVFERWHQPYPF